MSYQIVRMFQNDMHGYYIERDSTYGEDLLYSRSHKLVAVVDADCPASIKRAIRDHRIINSPLPRIQRSKKPVRSPWQ